MDTPSDEIKDAITKECLIKRQINKIKLVLFSKIPNPIVLMADSPLGPDWRDVLRGHPVT